MIDNNSKKSTDMKTVKVLYTKKNFSPFDYMFNGKIRERIYKEDGEFDRFEDHTPSVEHYVPVTEVEFENERSDEDILNWVVRSHNAGSYPKEITDKIRNGELNVEFSSFSTGCVVQIDGSYHISNGMGFDLLPLEFSNDN